MSWDVFFQDLPKDVKTFQEIPDDFHPGVLCDRVYYVQMMTNIFPTADFSEPNWISLSGDTFSIEFNSGDEEYVECLTLHVRGGEESLKEIQRIMEYTGWSAIDSTSGEIINKESEIGKGLKEHNAFVKQISEVRKKNWWEIWK